MPFPWLPVQGMLVALTLPYTAICNFPSHSSTPDTFTPDGSKTWLLGDRVESIAPAAKKHLRPREGLERGSLDIKICLKRPDRR